MDQSIFPNAHLFKSIHLFFTKSPRPSFQINTHVIYKCDQFFPFFFLFAFLQTVRWFPYMNPNILSLPCTTVIPLLFALFALFARRSYTSEYIPMIPFDRAEIIYRGLVKEFKGYFQRLFGDYVVYNQLMDDKYMYCKFLASLIKDDNNWKAKYDELWSQASKSQE
eukprot:796169_1